MAQLGLIRMISPNRLIAFVIISFCIYMSWLPVFTADGAWMTFDLIAHTDRAISTVNEIKNGQFLAFFDFSYPFFPGYSWNLFYPPLENFIYSGLYFISNNLNISLKLLTLFIIIISFIHSYIAFVYLNVNKEKAILLAVLFSCSIYQIDNIFIRGALPESVAISFIPLFIASLAKEENGKKAALMMSYAVAGILLSNIPLFLCCGIVGFIYFLLVPKKLLLLVQSFSFAILLSAFFFLPLVYSIHNQVFPIMATNWFQNMSEKSIGFYDLISGEKISTGKLSNMALGVGWPVFIMFLCSLKETVNKKIIYAIAILAVLITCAANYSFLPEFLYSINKIQYTWRLIPFLIFFVLIIISHNQKIKPIYLIASILAISFMSTWMSFKSINNFDITESNFRGPKNTVFTDYTLENTKKLTEYKKELVCISLTDMKYQNVPYSISRGKYGLPYFSFHTDKEIKCRLPIMAYTALSIEGNRDVVDGYLSYKTKVGDNLVKTEYSKNFLYSMLLGFVLTFLSVILFFHLALYKGKNNKITKNT